MHKSLFPTIIAPGIEFRITNTEVQWQRKIRSQQISLLPADNLSFLEKEKQSCTVRASTRWFLLGEVLQGVYKHHPRVINPLPALMGTARHKVKVWSGASRVWNTGTWKVNMVLSWQGSVPLLWDTAGQPVVLVPYHRPSSFRVLQVRGRNQNSGYHLGSGYLPRLTNQYPVYVWIDYGINVTISNPQLSRITLWMSKYSMIKCC